MGLHGIVRYREILHRRRDKELKMTTYIGSNTVQLKCDCIEGCDEVTPKIFSINAIDSDETFRRMGWFVSMSDDKTYCPKHSPYNNTGK